jgi:hypothetical protein
MKGNSWVYFNLERLRKIMKTLRRAGLWARIKAETSWI